MVSIWRGHTWDARKGRKQIVSMDNARKLNEITNKEQLTTKQESTNRSQQFFLDFHL